MRAKHKKVNNTQSQHVIPPSKKCASLRGMFIFLYNCLNMIETITMYRHVPRPIQSTSLTTPVSMQYSLTYIPCVT